MNEPTLSPTRLLAIDGNNSAKRVASAASADQRVFQSSYFRAREDVDRFKDKVKRKVPAVVTNEEAGGDEVSGSRSEVFPRTLSITTYQ